MLDKVDGRSLRSCFLQSSSKFSPRQACFVRGVGFSYAQLEETARQWAAAMLAASQRPPQRVGVFAYRSHVAYAGTLAALFAGATFVPLNPVFPIERTRAMAESADLDVVIVDKMASSQLAALLSEVNIPVALLPQFDDVAAFQREGTALLSKARLDGMSPLAELPQLTPEDTAYLLFTSGSTGAPKGVPVSHGNAVHYIDVMSERYQLTAQDRLSQTFDQTFDLSVFDLFMSWTCGACFYSATPIELLAPPKFVNHHQLSVWFSVPSTAVQMKRRGTLTPNSMPGLRYSLFCGEALPADIAAAWQAAAPNSIVENLYGPTELTISCFAHRWDSETSPAISANGVVPIGRPNPGLAALIVDDQLLPVADGEPGELCVNGPQTVTGYWNEPVKTAEKFVSLPWSPKESRRFYRTGDRSARVANGEYVYLGRTDQQIKVLGHRVELGEIEAVLRKSKGVEHAVAMGWPPATNNAEWVVAVVSGEGMDIPAVTRSAQASLPAYMVPKRIEVMEEIPLNANGKVDRNQVRARLLESVSGEVANVP